MAAKATPGIRVRHSRGCAGDTNCTCKPSYEAWAYDAKARKKIRGTFQSLAAAKSWRRDATADVARKQLAWYPSSTVRNEAEKWLAACEHGKVLSRFGRPYAPSALRGYRADIKRYVDEPLGAMKLRDVTRVDIQHLIDTLNGKGLSGSKVRNVVVALQAMFRWADQRNLVRYDPTVNLALPTVGGRREWSCTQAEGAALLEALPDDVKAVFATALYAGLRRGELRALRVSNLRILNGVGAIDVRHSFDAYEGERETKSRAGVREVPLPSILREILDAHVTRLQLEEDAILFPQLRSRTRPFDPHYAQGRADDVWKEAGLARATLHELRHAYASFLDAAGIPETRQRRYLGHASADVTSRYRHQIDGQLAEDARWLDAYLALTANDATGATTGAQDLETSWLSQSS